MSYRGKAIPQFLRIDLIRSVRTSEFGLSISRYGPRIQFINSKYITFIMPYKSRVTHCLEIVELFDLFTASYYC